ncbi:beta-ketoacyl-ACP synthase 3 [Actinokineospora fastidiosa]|uniref:3-oxoacyl-[acyl-carrier-protein] synthase 3 n=1 Tax=Actinokineospora fastidiosa TaxID=1816 RepID=A0A918GM86_9PSEU|nr:beta-ketoacyl-ACP synthase 3 [Actinokineospora fastidiosa]GGS47674.1 3-oxoacyl-[acyl-carrier-protein] synthase 3 [Actinokineospora fastidiosa]
MAVNALRRTTGAAGAQLVGVGAYRPDLAVDSAGIADRFGRTGEWVRERTGIVSRRFADESESIEVMGAAAASRALDHSGLPAADVDLVIVATCSARSPIPGLAAGIADAVGAGRAAGFDLNAACAGFCYALGVAADTVRAGSARTVLVVGAERMSAWVDPTDLGTSIIFGDGAGAAVVTAADEPGIGPVVWGSDGSAADLIHIPDGGLMHMAGQSVFRWATTEIHPIALQACERAGIRPADLSAIVPHQANLRIINALAAKIGAPDAAVARDVVDAGNTSAASIPMAIDRMLAEGQADPGGLALLVGFGAGLTYAAQVVRLPLRVPAPV